MSSRASLFLLSVAILCAWVGSSGLALAQSYWLGVDVTVAQGEGLRVTLVRPDTPGTKMTGAGIVAALEPGDVLVRANGQFLDSPQTLQQAMAANRGVLDLDVRDVSSGVVRSWRVQAEQRGGAAPPQGPPPPDRIAMRPVSGWSLGLEVSEVAGTGLRIHSVQPNGPATQLTLVNDPNTRGLLEPGDVIVRVNDTLIDTAAGLQSTLQRYSGKVRLTVRDAKHGDMTWYAQANSFTGGAGRGGQSDSPLGQPITTGLRMPRKPPAIPSVP